MARKYVPPVRRRKKGASGSSKISLIRQRERKTDRLLNTIRALALKEQRAKPQIFLSLREAADRFGTRTSAMATVYRQLTQEGILIGIRSSHPESSADTKCGAGMPSGGFFAAGDRIRK